VTDVARHPIPASIGRAFLGLGPLLVILAYAVVQGAILASAGGTLGYDFEAYRAASERILAGQPLYDAAAAVAGPRRGLVPRLHGPRSRPSPTWFA